MTEPKITIEIVGDITIIALFTENYCEQTSTPSIPALEVLPVAVWESPLQLEEADAAIKAAIEEKQSEKTAEKEQLERLVMQNPEYFYNILPHMALYHH